MLLLLSFLAPFRLPSSSSFAAFAAFAAFAVLCCLGCPSSFAGSLAAFRGAALPVLPFAAAFRLPLLLLPSAAAAFGPLLPLLPPLAACVPGRFMLLLPLSAVSRRLPLPLQTPICHGLFPVLALPPFLPISPKGCQLRLDGRPPLIFSWCFIGSRGVFLRHSPVGSSARLTHGVPRFKTAVAMLLQDGSLHATSWGVPCLDSFWHPLTGLYIEGICFARVLSLSASCPLFSSRRSSLVSGFGFLRCSVLFVFPSSADVFPSGRFSVMISGSFLPATFPHLNLASFPIVFGCFADPVCNLFPVCVFAGSLHVLIGIVFIFFPANFFPSIFVRAFPGFGVEAAMIACSRPAQCFLHSPVLPFSVCFRFPVGHRVHVDRAPSASLNIKDGNLHTSILDQNSPFGVLSSFCHMLFRLCRSAYQCSYSRPSFHHFCKNKDANLEDTDQPVRG